VVTDQGGPKFLITSGETGYVAESDRDFIEKAISLMTDAETHRRMRLAARRAACTASWDTVFEEVWKSYEICIQLPGKKAAVPRGQPLESEHAA